MRAHIPAAALAVLALLAACADQPVTPAPRTAGLSLAPAKACAESPTVVVHTDPELRSALASSSPGDVIAISGTIALDSFVVMNTPGVTVTCAEPGAGLSLAPGNEFALLYPRADEVTIQGLELDGEYGYSPIYSITDEFNGLQNIRITGNEIYCGYTACLFAAGAPGMQITDNHWKGEHTRYGVHIQGFPGSATGGDGPTSDGVVISRNVIENEDGYIGVYGAIRVREGHNVTITHNQVSGDWSHGVVLTNIFDSRVEHNRIDGTMLNGIEFSAIAAARVSLGGLSIRGNQITNAGGAAMAIRRACGNTFEGNLVRDNALGVRFEASTGDNLYRGNNEVVEDAGAFDCDQDGDVDPNQISGVQFRAPRDTLPGPPPPAGPLQ
ncbi:MAG TPA: right-handed parallel beta-helix repeat-containing protein [Longimicrobium sp.]|nr:right-handed parallel beta-helix repeat-containing protein [Longimicrobium sp.]